MTKLIFCMVKFEITTTMNIKGFQNKITRFFFQKKGCSFQAPNILFREEARH